MSESGAEIPRGTKIEVKINWYRYLGEGPKVLRWFWASSTEQAEHQFAKALRDVARDARYHMDAPPDEPPEPNPNTDSDADKSRKDAPNSETTCD